MIHRISNHHWHVIYGPFEQHVIGTRQQAQQTLQQLRRRWKSEIDRLPWYSRWIGRLNMKMIDLVVEA